MRERRADVGSPPSERGDRWRCRDGRAAVTPNGEGVYSHGSMGRIGRRGNVDGPQFAASRRAARRGRIGVLVLVTAVVVPNPVGARSARAATDVCSLVTADEAHVAIGAQPAAFVTRPGTCTWRSNETGCAFRVLSVEVTRGRAVVALATLRAGTAPVIDAATGAIGDDAAYTVDELPAGSAIAVERLHLRVGDTLAVVTLLGRISPSATRDVLAALGAHVAARL